MSHFDQLTFHAPPPRIALIGMGYVGAVSAAALASNGCHVTGVEVNHVKLDMLKKGNCPVFEPGVEALMRQAVEDGLMDATDNLTVGGRQRTLLMGLSFKAGTDDLRESPMVELAERLLGKGVPLSIYDNDLLPGQLLGANARYIQDHLPHLNLLLRDDLDDALSNAQTVVIAKSIDQLSDRQLAGKTVIDLTQGPAPAAADSTTQRMVA